MILLNISFLFSNLCNGFYLNSTIRYKDTLFSGPGGFSRRGQSGGSNLSWIRKFGFRAQQLKGKKPWRGGVKRRRKRILNNACALKRMPRMHSHGRG
eukprot:GHVL01019800.1.p1 GENE.GHVL01019800.1~~GHVL01019800.1.p1  ORF type:complete len:112 (-),score=20.03 GHVL01019800.1:365-655(-)